MSQPIGLAIGILFRYSAISSAIFSVKFNNFMSFLTAISHDNLGLPFLLAFPFPVALSPFLIAASMLFVVYDQNILFYSRSAYCQLVLFLLFHKCFISKSEFLGLTTSPYKHLHLSYTNFSNMLFVGCLMLCPA